MQFSSIRGATAARRHGAATRGRTLLLGLALAPLTALPAALDLGSLTRLSLEELANITVTSVSRREESLHAAPASVYVVTREDIRRSGVSTLPEALRLAPNLQVARADANQYAITARGSNSVLANKMLVMIDGRTVYSPLFSGVFWDAQDVMLEDVERIEVISGPGTTLWGSNAVNGVISILTRPAADTHGTLVSGGAGNRNRNAAVRHGGKLGEDGHFRLYGKLSERGNTVLANGNPVRDASDLGQGGFRADWKTGARGITLQGDAYGSSIDQVPGTRRISGANLLARWTQQFEGIGELSAQTYFDQTERDQPGAIRERLDTLDLELQYGLLPRSGHRLLFGAGYRHARDRVENLNPAALGFLPPHRTLGWLSLFAQDEIHLRDAVNLTLGLKLEHNAYTGFEQLPSARLDWKPAEDHFLWGAVSRAVRAPARIDRELFAPAAAPFLLAGGPGFQSETANVYELGYRTQLANAGSLSVTAFHHDFERLRSLELRPGGAAIENRNQGTLSGVEAWVSQPISNAWRIKAGMTRQRARLRHEPGSTDASTTLGNDPRYWFTLHSSFDMTPDHDFDVIGRRVGALPNGSVPTYSALDARLAWRALHNLELSLTVNNLLDRRHPEWGVPATRAELERGLYFKALWQP